MKLLIVDDEAKIRKGLKMSINWSTIGIDEVFIASDGIGALEIYKKYKPEIVVTDVRMPGIDGIELCREIRKLSNSTKLIIISGYSEFEYARKAMQLNVKAYELKPVNIEELKRDIVESKNMLEDELKNADEKNNYELIYKNKTIDSILINKDIINKEEIFKFFNKYYNFQEKEIIVCLVVEIDNFTNVSINICNHEKNAMITYVENLFCKLIDDKKAITYIKSENSLIAILGFMGTTLLGATKNFFQNIHTIMNTNMKQNFNTTLSFGVSRLAEIEQITELYSQSCETLKNKFYKGNSCLSFFNDTDYITESEYPIVVDEVKFKEIINNYDYKAATELIKSEFDYLKSKKCVKGEVVRDYSIHLMNLLIYFIDEIGFNYKELFSKNLDCFEITCVFDTMDGYQTWITNLYYFVLSEIFNIRGIKNNVLMIKAVQYLKKNYNKNISIEDLAAYVMKNPTYFGQLLKKEIGMSFAEYVNRLRITEAKKLMRSTTLLCYEISEKVGFNDYKYFTQVFKKIEGYAPTELRKGKNLATTKIF